MESAKSIQIDFTLVIIITIGKQFSNCRFLLRKSHLQFPVKSHGSPHQPCVVGGLPAPGHWDLHRGAGAPTAPLTACRSGGGCILTPSFSFPQLREVSLTPRSLENYYLTHEPWMYVLPLGASTTCRPSAGLHLASSYTGNVP